MAHFAENSCNSHSAKTKLKVSLTKLAKKIRQNDVLLAEPCVVSLPVWCLPTYMMSVYLYNVFLPLWWRSSGWFLLTCVLSAQLCNVCSTVWWLLNFMLHAYLFDVCSFVPCSIVLCLPIWMTSYQLYDYWLKSVYQYDFLLPIFFALMYDVCLPYDVFLPLWCLLNYCWMMSTYLYEISSPM